ncbi:HEPN domain-containing protein [Saccharospirillum salsuginis]|uniref:DNA-binding protein n=1 Tax=Saccharospirillum salsuginis TaxID=418750 RepID=A0A918K9V0_9GAMM|nr:HEPN domain-containing protein [Saccharospirillum salsuginis]GGX55451.1 DNA-binding protein [Saccharospirillum salsuginis]
MKTSLDHLPEPKRHELRRAVDIILESVKPEMLILFGSYARGDWQEEMADDGVHYQYQSDFDLLAVAKSEAKALRIERKDSLRKELSRSLRTPVTLIAHDIHFVNRNLTKGQFFFADILKEGVMLHDSGKLELAEPGALSPKERKRLAEQDFEYWMEKVNSVDKKFRFCLAEEEYTEAAFDLHQKTERLYNAILLVFTRYKPKTHDLERLSDLVASLEPEFLKVFPQGSREEKDRFELLRQAYVSARYSPAYRITREDLDWLSERVQLLQSLAERLCLERIEGFDAAATDPETS